MAFTPVNELEQLLVAATRDPGARPAFYQGLTEHDLLVIGEGELGANVADANTKVQIQMVDMQGKPHVAIFTSKERIAAVVKGEMPYIAMNGRALLTMVRGADLMMNPGADFGKQFLKAEVEAILDGSILNLGPTRNVGGQQLLLSQPSEYPRHITEALGLAFLKYPKIQSAHLAQAHFSTLDQKPHTMIAIKTAGDWKAEVSEIGLVAQSVARPGEVIDFVQMTDRDDDGVSKYMKSVEPFYRREA